MLEKYLIEHCSPTLASLRTANLFTCTCDSEEELQRQIEFWNCCVGGKGISVRILRKTEGTALIYVCRMEFLKRDLARPGVAEFLHTCGYSATDAASALKCLQDRLEKNDGFPHEIGIFLGYPLGDVVGFIENAGKNSKCSGCWKVYCNECETIRLFEKFKKCKDVYMRLWMAGRTVTQLTVAA